jgi:hypothetical protein
VEGRIWKLDFERCSVLAEVCIGLLKTVSDIGHMDLVGGAPVL